MEKKRKVGKINKKSNFGKKRRESWKKNEKIQKRRRRKNHGRLLYSDLGMEKQWFPHRLDIINYYYNCHIFIF